MNNRDWKKSERKDTALFGPEKRAPMSRAE